VEVHKVAQQDDVICLCHFNVQLVLLPDLISRGRRLTDGALHLLTTVAAQRFWRYRNVIARKEMKWKYK